MKFLHDFCKYIWSNTLSGKSDLIFVWCWKISSLIIYSNRKHYSTYDFIRETIFLQNVSKVSETQGNVCFFVIYTLEFWKKQKKRQRFVLVYKNKQRDFIYLKNKFSQILTQFFSTSWRTTTRVSVSLIVVYR